ncbi:hypothetical protein J6590_012223 [Homalodisca vitripennis]|nr:hypothetical protein J6590_012223 [Homalodisca vitripennis]
MLQDKTRLATMFLEAGFYSSPPTADMRRVTLGVCGEGVEGVGETTRGREVDGALSLATQQPRTRPETYGNPASLGAVASNQWAIEPTDNLKRCFSYIHLHCTAPLAKSRGRALIVVCLSECLLGAQFVGGLDIRYACAEEPKSVREELCRSDAGKRGAARAGAGQREFHGVGLPTTSAPSSNYSRKESHRLTQTIDAYCCQKNRKGFGRISGDCPSTIVIEGEKEWRMIQLRVILSNARGPSIARRSLGPGSGIAPTLLAHTSAYYSVPSQSTDHTSWSRVIIFSKTHFGSINRLLMSGKVDLAM